MKEKLLKKLEEEAGVKAEQLQSNLWTISIGIVSLYFDEVIEQDERIVSLSLKGEHFCDFNF